MEKKKVGESRFGRRTVPKKKKKPRRLVKMTKMGPRPQGLLAPQPQALGKKSRNAGPERSTTKKGKKNENGRLKFPEFPSREPGH